MDALVLKVSLKVGLGLGGTRPPSFLKKIVCHVGLDPSRKKCGMPSYYSQKTYIRPNENGKITSFAILPFGKDGQLSGKKSFHYCLKNRFFIV